MHPSETLKELVELQRIDSGLDELEKIKKNLLQESLSLDVGVATQKNKLQEEKKNLENLLKQRKTLEIEAGALDHKITKYLGQQNEVKSNEQFLALKQEIEKCKEEKGVIEEKVLDLLFQEDELKKNIQDMTADLERFEKKAAEGKKEIQQKAADCDKAAGDKREERKKQASLVSGDFAAGYEALRGHGKKIAVAQVLDDQTCGGCHMNVPPQILNELKKNMTIQRCDCGRFLHLKG
ncbi:MAG TPA: C4-type zinc ribbon domain-containing protein [bacterium]|nr:C4-type zinc ribbon domain-containing protein [bacterium]